MIQSKGMAVSLGLAALLAGCGGSSGATYTVGASVSGLSGSGLVLRLSTGSSLAVTTNGNFVFAGSLASGASYQVTVGTQPSAPEQTCTVANGTGTIGAGNVTAAVACVTVIHKVGVTVSGLSGAGLVLQLNGSNDLPIMANGTATFQNGIDSGAAYAVTVQTQPTFPTQSCSVVNGSGTITTADVSGIAVTCPTAVTTLYSFTGGAANSTDGARPVGSLVQGSDGSLYGTTSLLGTAAGSTILGGVTFKITLSGQETILHRDMFPLSALVLGSDGNFYGAAPGPGMNDFASVYELSPAGAESILASISFSDAIDGRPLNGSGMSVIQGKTGDFYGIASTFDGYGVFAVYSPGAAGFLSSIGSGTFSTASLFQTTDGLLYGTANAGGTYGMGTVFTVNPAVTESGKTIYSFGASPGDGMAPGVPLIQGSDGNLYGTTATGGAPSTTCPQGCGTVFKITPAGTETVLYSFGNSPADGQGPSGALVLASDGNFYGATASGGSTALSGTPNSNCQNGCGTVYRITPSGIETVLYSFGSTADDGVGPIGALFQASDGNLYGATVAGGPANAGTVFKLTLNAN